MIAVLLAASLLPAALAADAPPAALFPPAPPRHEQRNLDTAGALARDLAEVVSFLEQGQSYFRAYQKGTHTTEENAALLRFLEAYERERDIAKKEARLLGAWVQERSELEPKEEKTQAP